MENKTETIEIECSNSKCGKISTFKIDSSKATCGSCGSSLKLKTSSRNNIIGISVVAATIGYSVANAPEWLQSKNDIIQMYESMNACMHKHKYYKKQRDICACTFAKTYEGFKYLNTNGAFDKNLKKCYE